MSQSVRGRCVRGPRPAQVWRLILDVPDMEAFQKLLQSKAGAEAMKFDGVRPDTIVILEKASDPCEGARLGQWKR